MRYRKLTSDGDYSFGSSAKDFYVDVPEAVAQAVQTSLLLWQGEFFLDTTDGTPYMEGIIGKHSQTLADNTMMARVRQVQGVVNLQNFKSVVDPNTRKYSASGLLNTIFGITQIQIANENNF